MRLSTTRSLLWASIALLATGAAIADPRTDADAAYGRGDFETGVKIDQQLAAQGDVQAMVNLGDAYSMGRGIPENLTQGLRWYVAAAEKGNELTGRILGTPPKGSKEAGAVSLQREVALTMSEDFKRWFPIAAGSSPVELSYNKAVRSLRAFTEGEDEESLLKQAAEQGSVTAAVALGHYYEKGMAGRPDSAKAISWYQRAADKGRADAMWRIGALSMSDDADEGLRWYRKAAEKGDGEAMFALGGAHAFFDGPVEKDSREAFKWHLAAANKGVTWAQLAVAERYHDGHGVTRNYAEAARWYRKVADAPSRTPNHSMALYTLGAMYLEGRGVARDPAEAIKLLKAASDDNDAEAMDFLGTLYALGIGVAKDGNEAARLYNAASKFNRENALYNLGVLYSNGAAAPVDHAVAQSWFEKAAAAGHARAKDRLAGRPYKFGGAADFVLPDLDRNTFTRGDCIRLASPTSGFAPYNGGPDVNIRQVRPPERKGDQVVYRFAVAASDPDKDALLVTVASSVGSLIDKETHWELTAPSSEQPTISFAADDQRGCRLAWSFALKPLAPPSEPAQELTVTLPPDPPGTRCSRTGDFAAVRPDTKLPNRAPTVKVELVSSTVTPDGYQLKLRATSSDPDSDSLLYTYSNISGSMSQDGPDATLILPEAGFAMVTVEVDDRHGCIAFGSFAQEVGKPATQ